MDYNMEFGARPLRRNIERLLEDPLSEEILRGAFKNVKRVNVSVHEDHLRFDHEMEEPPREEVPITADLEAMTLISSIDDAWSPASNSSRSPPLVRALFRACSMAGLDEGGSASCRSAKPTAPRPGEYA